MKADQHGADLFAAHRMLGYFVLHDRLPLLVPELNYTHNSRPEETP
jgi:hypothetical protein